MAPVGGKLVNSITDVASHLKQAWSRCQLAWWKLGVPCGEKGQAIMEYALLASLLSVVAMACIILIGPNLEELYYQVVAALNSTDPTAPSVLGIKWHCPPTSNGMHCR